MVELGKKKKQFKTENKNIGQDKKGQKSSVHLPSPPPLPHWSYEPFIIANKRFSNIVSTPLDFDFTLFCDS